MITTFKTSEIFCSVVDFCEDFIPIWSHQLLAGRKSHNKPALHSTSEDLKSFMDTGNTAHSRVQFSKSKPEWPALSLKYFSGIAVNHVFHHI